jgi:hypothetical protein
MLPLLSLCEMYIKLNLPMTVKHTGFRSSEKESDDADNRKDSHITPIYDHILSRYMFADKAAQT